MGLSDQWAKLVAFLVKNPKGWFSSWTQEIVQSWICADCGYLELYAVNPKELIEKFRNWRPSDPFPDSTV